VHVNTATEINLSIIELLRMLPFVICLKMTEKVKE